MGPIVDTPKILWRATSGRAWGWVMTRSDNRVVRQIPNLLTVLRLCSPVTAIWSCSAFLGRHYSQAWLWLVATGLLVFTDYLDGKAARSLKATSDIGKRMDPLTDKAIVATMLILLVEIESRPHFVGPYWAGVVTRAVVMALVIELILVYLSFIGWRCHWTPGTNRWGKHKFRCQSGVIGSTYILVYLTAAGLSPLVAPIFFSIGIVPAIALAMRSLDTHWRTRHTL